MFVFFVVKEIFFNFLELYDMFESFSSENKDKYLLLFLLVFLNVLEMGVLFEYVVVV